MELKRILQGGHFNVFAVVFDNGTCPAADFLTSVKQLNAPSYKSMVNLIKRHADFGPLLNKRKSRVIEGRENLLEFKTNQGDRLVYFYTKGRKTILTHGFHKGAVASEEYDKAEKIRDQYYKETNDGTS